MGRITEQDMQRFLTLRQRQQAADEQRGKAINRAIVERDKTIEDLRHELLATKVAAYIAAVAAASQVFGELTRALL
jgi:6-phosphogluconate dehydrogenase